jgi:hypothetical protein
VALATDVKRVVWASSVAVYGPSEKHPIVPVNEEAPTWPNLMYAYSKLMSEFLGWHYYSTLGLDNIGLRFEAVYGPGMELKGRATLHYFLFDLFKNGSLGKLCIVGEGDCLINWLFVKDCVQALIKACYAKSLKHRIFNIGGFEHTVREVASVVKELVPEADVNVVSEVLPGFKSFKKYGGLMSVDTARARQELGFQPSVHMKESVRELINYYRALAACMRRAGIAYFYTLIDDAIARVIKSEGGILWACKNYDGDVMSDLLGSAFGSLAIMSSVLVSPNGYFEYEAAHGTAQKHYYRYLKGEKTSTNPMAIIFAWSGALRKRGELDHIRDLIDFSNVLERATKETIEVDGVMTGDLANISDPPAKKVATTDEFIDAIGERLERLVQK